LSPHFGEWNTFATEFFAGAEEALAGVAFGEEGLVLLAELVPAVLEVVVVGSPDDVGESG
jgi:hypothetical protein